MKAVLLLFLISPLIGLSQDRSQILKLLEDQRLAWNRGDLAGYMEGYWKSDSLLFVGKNGPKYGWKTTFDNYKTGYPDRSAMGRLDFKILKVDLIDKQNVFVLGAWHLTRDKDEPQGYFTLLFRKVNGFWKIVADHSS